MTTGGRPGTRRLLVPFLPVGAALFSIQLDFFALSLALPSIASDFATSTTDLQWLLSGYMIAVGSLFIPAGRLGDMFGYRTVLVWGLGAFAVTSLVCGVTSSIPVLVAARVLQGAGAAMTLPNAFALVTTSTAEEVRPRIFGALLGIGGVGMALGPVIGGVLASTAGWRWVFLLNVPVAAVGVWGVARLRRPSRGPGQLPPGRMDWLGVATVVGGLVLVSAAIDDVGTQGWGDPATWGPLLGGVALLGAFGLVESRVAWPLVRPALMKNRPYLVLVVASTLANLGNCVSIVAATLELQNVRGFSAAGAGLVFFLASIGMALCGPLAGRLSVRFPAGPVIGVTMMLAAPALLLLAVAQPVPLYVAALALTSVATGMGYPLAGVAIQTALPPEHSAEGTGVLLTVLTAFGVVAATGVIEAVGDNNITSGGISLVLRLLAVILLIAGAATVIVELAYARRRRPLSASDGSGQLDGERGVVRGEGQRDRPRTGVESDGGAGIDASGGAA